MTFSSELPLKCSECVKSWKPLIHAKCDFCNDLGFQEDVLCDLNRRVQDPANFVCHAFQATLKLVGPQHQKGSPSPRGLKNIRSQISFRKLLSADKIGYERALALQKLDRHRDGRFADLKYHLVWNTGHRKPVFLRPADMFGFVADTFSNGSALVGGFVRLLWLAPDHLHFFVESDGENSIETIAQHMKRLSTSAILGEFSDLNARLDVENELWDKAYFAETVG